MKNALMWVFALVALLLLASNAEARGGRRAQPMPMAVPTAAAMPGLVVKIEPGPQGVAQKRADAMAATNTLSHNIHLTTKAPNWTLPGVRGEGIGWSMGLADPKQTPTCIMSNLAVADALARSRNGAVYRVRLFR
jgi:hypothetical protein